MMSGYWFLSSDSVYTPPPELVEFLKHNPVYIGFGSMKANSEFSKTLSTLAIKSLHLAGVKGVLLGGWAGLTREALDTSTEEGKRLYAWAEKNVFEIRIFDPATAASKGMAVANFQSLDAHLDLILFSGSFNKNTDSVQLEKTLKNAA